MLQHGFQYSFSDGFQYSFSDVLLAIHIS